MHFSTDPLFWKIALASQWLQVAIVQNVQALAYDSRDKRQRQTWWLRVAHETAVTEQKRVRSPFDVLWEAPFESSTLTR